MLLFRSTFITAISAFILTFCAFSMSGASHYLTLGGFVVLVLIPSPKASAAPQFGRLLLHVLHDTTPSVSESVISDTRCKPNRSGSRELGAYCGSAEFAGTSYDSDSGWRSGSQSAGRRSTIIYQLFLCMYNFIQSVLGYILNIDRRVRPR